MRPSARSITDVNVDLAPFNLPRQQAVADDADGEFLEEILLGMLDEEENDSGFQSLSNMSEVLSGNEHVPPVISGSHLQDVRPPNYVWDPDASASSSSLSSENTCVPSMTMDEEYFDPEALLRDLAPSTEVCPRGSHQVRIQPPPSGKSVFHSPLTMDEEYFDPEALLRDLAPSTEVSPRGSHQVNIQPPPSGSPGGSNKKSLVINIVVSASMPSRYIGGLSHTHPPAAASV